MSTTWMQDYLDRNPHVREILDAYHEAEEVYAEAVKHLPRKQVTYRTANSANWPVTTGDERTD